MRDIKTQSGLGLRSLFRDMEKVFLLPFFFLLPPAPMEGEHGGFSFASCSFCIDGLLLLLLLLKGGLVLDQTLRGLN